jgi:ubiquinone/menaquinone biosynthesis C-methylase UbiE
MTTQLDYEASLRAESKKWGEHLKVEAQADSLGDNWLGHPLISQHYAERGLVDGLPWPQWIGKRLGEPAERSLDLGCGSGEKSFEVFRAGASRCVEGIDISTDRLREAEARLREQDIPGRFREADVNTIQLPENSFDLIFSWHSFHHFLELEHIMQQVHQALTSRGLFVLEEFVGPTQFQWTDLQIELVQAMLGFLPKSLRMYRAGWAKKYEGRSTPEEVQAVSPFESIRSGEIVALFKRYFHVVRVRQLGGTLQHLLYNGILHNFLRDKEQSEHYVKAIYEMEDALMNFRLIPSDFMLLIGQRRDAPQTEPAELVPEVREGPISYVSTELVGQELAQLRMKEAELDGLLGSRAVRILKRYGKFKYKYLLPVCRSVGRFVGIRRSGNR